MDTTGRHQPGRYQPGRINGGSFQGKSKNSYNILGIRNK